MDRELVTGTKAELVDLLKRRGELTVGEAVEALDRGETTVRQHVDWLSERALVDYRRESDGPGRPTHVYHLTELGERLYPSKGGEVLRELLEFLEQTGEQELVVEFFRQYWESRWKEFEGCFAPDATAFRDQIEALAEFLDDEGFMPEIAGTDEGAVEIRECNCPLRDVVAATRIPCQLEAEFMERAVDGSLERVEYMPEGNDACTYLFAEPEPS
ncbi:MAG: helix-turn-helix transcriptional regulator [Bradymonadaceae bacterium]